MKSVGTINEILDLFYNRVDDISIHTKHIVANGKYSYELKVGISLEEYKVTRKQLLSQFEKRQEV